MNADIDKGEKPEVNRGLTYRDHGSKLVLRVN